MPFLPAEVRGRLVIMGLLAYAGPVAEAEAALRPFREIATPIADLVRPMPYAEMFPPEDPNFHPTTVIRNLFVNRISAEDGETIVERLTNSKAPMRVAQIRVLGGAAARVPNDATAYAHRNSAIMVNVAAFYTSPEDRLVQDRWVEALRRGASAGGQGRLRQLPWRRGRGAGAGSLSWSDLGPSRCDQAALRSGQPVPAQPEHPAGSRRGAGRRQSERQRHPLLARLRPLEPQSRRPVGGDDPVLLVCAPSPTGSRYPPGASRRRIDGASATSGPARILATIRS